MTDLNIQYDSHHEFDISRVMLSPTIHRIAASRPDDTDMDMLHVQHASILSTILCLCLFVTLLICPSLKFVPAFHNPATEMQLSQL